MTERGGEWLTLAAQIESIRQWNHFDHLGEEIFEAVADNETGSGRTFRDTLDEPSAAQGVIDAAKDPSIAMLAGVDPSTILTVDRAINVVNQAKQRLPDLLALIVAEIMLQMN